MREIVRLIVLYIIIQSFFIPDSSGQDVKVVGDLRAIQEASVSKSFAKKWEVEIGAKAIIDKDISQLGEFDINASVFYKPFKCITLGVGYQFSENRTSSGDFEIRHRYNGNIEAGTKLNRFRVDYRLRYQNTDDELLSNDDVAYVAKNILRNKIQLKYNIKNCKLTPFVYGEHYGQLNKDLDYGLKLKFALGGNFSFTNRHQVRLYYRLDHELNNSHPYTYHNLCVEYTFKL
jgi:hypothetical protein